MNTPNKLTILRIMFVPFFMAFLLIDTIPYRYLFALIIFCLASLTDMLDGKIARETGQVTNFGKFADPLADKILVMSAFICFIQIGLSDALVAIIILAREFMVTSMRLVAIGEGKVVAANKWGKAKTISQILSIIIVLLIECLIEFNIIKDLILINNISIVGNIFIWISALFTIISGFIYMYENKNLILKK